MPPVEKTRNATSRNIQAKTHTSIYFENSKGGRQDDDRA